ncbi:hypothetical protein [Pseudoduganella lutea]|uniref:Uncharacterized protein n=1 Tax=Pseudoduganella lutea TaxID=321985 RepID=A0A4P6L2B1_9BURK|nr:hypothetical protein [Pseudoduganella lutea]QBE65726.1 hypothetical protein EWM63_24360 [Pseudoduganella lutea]
MASRTTRNSLAPWWHPLARLSTLAIAFFFSHLPSASARDEFRDRSVIGTWQLVSVLDFATIASLDAAETKTLLGKFLTISETAVRVGEELCSQPEFWAERVIPEPHMQEKLHSSAQRLHLPTPVTMVELGCTDVYIRNPGQLVLLWGGAMFDAVRIDPARRQASKALPVTKRAIAKTVPGKPLKPAMDRKPRNKRQAGERPPRKARSHVPGAWNANELF